MGFSYKPLFKLLIEQNMKKTDLLTEAGISSATLAKLSKGEPLSGESIEKLCVYFRCQPGNLVEYIFTEAPVKTLATVKPDPVSNKKKIHKPISISRPVKTKRAGKQ